jgi:hypothetical protein
MMETCPIIPVLSMIVMTSARFTSMMETFPLTSTGKPNKWETHQHLRTFAIGFTNLSPVDACGLAATPISTDDIT